MHSTLDTLDILLENNIPNLAWFRDEIHPNKRGFRKVAQRIRDIAEQKNYWPR